MNKRPTQLLPDHHSHRSGPFAIHTHTALKASDPLVLEMESLARSVTSTIGGPPPANGDVVDVYILKDEESFRHFLRFFHPELPPRRAYFIASGKNRSIYTFQGAHLMEDLRHEATHALVNLTHPGLPLWLDEGLAESFEHPERSTTPDTHREKFLVDVNAGALPNLPKLESVTDVRQLTPRDYREAWAWVQWGLAGPEPARKAFRNYLDDVGRAGEIAGADATKPLSRRWTDAMPNTDTQEARMVAWLGSDSSSGQMLAAAKVKNDQAVSQARLQNVETERGQSTSKSRSIPSGGYRKPGFFRRLFGG